MYTLRILSKKIRISILIIFFLGTVSHFIYDLTGQLLIVGCLFPINESIWEHLKLLLIPMIAWWSIFYVRYSHKYNLNIDKWFSSSLVALITSMYIQLSTFYIYTGAFNIEYLIIDILIFLLAVTLGQYMGLHFYKYGKEHNYKICILVILLIIILFIFMTFYPPHLPLFLDMKSGGYGL